MLRIGFTRSNSEGGVCACATADETTFEEFAESLGSDETALAFFSEMPPETEESSVAALEALIKMGDAREGTVCYAMEWLLARVFVIGRELGRREALAGIDEIIAKTVAAAKATGPTTFDGKPLSSGDTITS